MVLAMEAHKDARDEARRVSNANRHWGTKGFTKVSNTGSTEGYTKVVQLAGQY